MALAVVVARPARTDPIVDADGERVPGSIAELTTVDVNGHDLALMIRGRSTDNPVVLYLAGGPGGSELGAMRNHLESLEHDFVVATWDQRGSGKSYGELDPTSTITVPGWSTTRSSSRTTSATGSTRTRSTCSVSHGARSGVLAVQQRPELYRAFIGTGQMVSPAATDSIIYEDTLGWARANGKAGLVSTLTDIGPPPYDNILHYETALSYEHEVYPYDHTNNSEGEGGFSENILAEEYALIEQVHNLAAFLDSFAVIYPQLQDIDFRTDATELDVPMYFVQGAHEADGRVRPFEEWFAALDAPSKQLVVLETSGHRPLFEQPERFTEVMVDTVLEQSRSISTPGLSIQLGSSADLAARRATANGAGRWRS